MDPCSHGIGCRLEGIKKGAVDTYNGTGLMNGSKESQSKPGQSRALKRGTAYSLWYGTNLTAVEKILRALHRGGTGLESDPLLGFHTLGARGAI